MALFKILRGSKENLPEKKTDGYCYFTTDTGMFYIDISDNERLALNANDAQTLLGKTVITDVTKDSVDIPTSGAVWEAIKDLSTSTNTALDTKMNKNNPTGTGYFSLNRKAGSSVGGYSFAEGYNTTASGSAAHAEGSETIASGNRSHAEGYQTKAESDDMHVQGRYNLTTSDMAHVVGWGSETELKDIHTLDTEGNAWFDGKVTIGNGNKLIDHETTIRNLKLDKTAPRMVKRDNDLYLFTNSCFVISKDGGATFGNYTELCLDEKADSGTNDGKAVEVRTITPIVLKDGRIAVFYSVVYRTEEAGYGAIRLRYVDRNNQVSDYINVVIDDDIPHYITTGASKPMGGLWEPFPYYIGDKLYVYYCDSTYTNHNQQSVNYIKFNDDMSIESSGKAIAEINPESGLNRRPGMPSVTKLNINDITKYYMVVESNDKTYINNDENAINNSMGVAIALFSSLDGENWEFNKLLFTDHGTSRAGAPYVIALPNGKIAFSFQCLDNSIEGTVGDTDGPYKRRVYTYISKENTEEPKDRQYEQINIYNYAPNEAGYWSGLFELNGVLYTLFTHGLNNHYGLDTDKDYTSLGNIIITNKTLSDEILYVHNGEGDFSTEENMYVKASGEYSHAEGTDTIASGKRAHAEGWNTQATSDAAHAEGKLTIASGYEAHAEGYGTVAGSGTIQAHSNTTSAGYFTHAEGHATKASGHAAHSEGIKTIASGNYAHAEGGNTEASGQYSHSQGNTTRALGTNTAAMGLGTVAVNANEVVIGKYNIPTTSAPGYIRNYKGEWASSRDYVKNDSVLYKSNYYTCKSNHTSGTAFDTSKWTKISGTSSSLHLLTIGNGTSDTDRTNAATVDASGNAWFAGDVKIGTNNETLATKTEVETATSYATTRNDVLYIEHGANNVTNRNLTDKIIVNFGDSIFARSRPPEDISTELANLTGATVYNCAFGGCKMAQYSAGWDAFSMYRLADAIVSRDWSLQDAALSSVDIDYASEVLTLLKSIDFSTVNIITIAYGTNDWGGDTGSLDNDTNKLDTTSFGGALRYSIEKLLTAFPNLQIFIISPTYRYFHNTNGSFKDDVTTRVIKGLYLGDYVEKSKEIAKEYFIPFIDNFYELGINKHNRTHYFANGDGTHHIATGRRLIAEHIAKELF